MSGKAFLTWIEALPFGVCFSDESGLILGWNGPLEDITGKLRQDVLGTSIFELYPALGTFAIRQRIQALGPHAPSVNLSSALHPGIFKSPESADLSLFQVHISRVELEDRIMFCYVVQDRGTAPILQHRLEEMVDKLSRQNERLGQRSKDAELYFHQASHDLRSGLSSIQDLLFELQHQEESGRIFPTLHHVVDNLLGLTEQILNLGQSSQKGPQMEKLDLKEELRLVYERFRVRALRQGVSFSLKDELPDFPDLYGFPLQLNQILGNLIDNAFKYGVADQKQARVELSAAVLAQTGSSLRIRLQVLDNGAGMSSRRIQELFYPWVRQESLDPTHGFGLGLSICARLADSIGGALTVCSEPDLGTVFSLTADFHDSGIQAEKATESKEKLYVLKQGSRVLLLEDDPLQAAVLHHRFKRSGYLVEHAASVAKAKKYLSQQTYDLILVDLGMASMFGETDWVQTLSREQPGALLIAMSVIAPEKDLVHLKGLHAFWLKPVTTAMIQSLQETEEARLEPVSLRPKNIALMQSILEHCDGDREFAHKLIQGFLKDGAERLKRLEQNLELELARKELHGWYGSSVTLGMDEFALILQEVQENPEGGISRIRRAWDEVRGSLAPLCQHLAGME